MSTAHGPIRSAPGPDRPTPASAGALLSVEGLSLDLTGDRPCRLVESVSFALAPGELVGIVGESGCGKSITALSLLGLTDRSIVASGGRVMFRGQDLLQADERRMRRVRGNEIAMVFQEPMTSLNPVFTIGDQIGESVMTHRAVSRREARCAAIASLVEVGIPSPEIRVDSYPHQLSGGMRQRAMIAMALVCDPSLLIADEPTTALDVTIQAQILDLIRRLCRDRGLAVILITHDLGVVAELADEILVMYAGRIVERARADDLFADPRHPYTRALLRSRPPIDVAHRRLPTIPGMVPSPQNRAQGCKFADRCPQARAVCSAVEPELAAVAAGHLAACIDRGERRE